jgi:hypothetical protein
VYVGDVRGYVSCFKFSRADRSREALAQTQTEARIGKRIEKLRADRVIGTLFVLADGVLTAVDLETLAIQQRWDKSVSLFCLNEHPEFSGNMAFTAKRKIQKYQIAPPSSRERFVSVPEDLALPDTPVAMAWYEESLCLGFTRRPYIIVHSGNGTTIKEIASNTASSFIPYVRAIEDMFYCCVSNVLVPIYSRNGENAYKSPVVFTEGKKFLGVTHQSQFLITVSENCIEVFNFSDHAPMQKETNGAENAIQAMAESSEPLIIATTRFIMSMRPIPYRDQIRNLLQECRVSEAQQILENNISLDDEGLAQKEKFNLDAAWCLFRKLSFTKSSEYFALTNFDPRDLMSLFGDLASSSIFLAGSRVQTVSALVSEVFMNEPSKGVTTQGINLQVAETTIQCKLVVLSLLKERRNAIFRPSKSAQSSEMLNFLHSDYSFNKVVQVSMTKQEILELTDLFLFKMYVDIGLSDGATKLKDKFGKTYLALIEEMLDPAYKPYFSVENCIEFLGRFREQTPMIQAMVYEYFDNKDQALTIWRDLGASRDIPTREQAARQTAKILLKCTDRNYVLQNVRWVLKSFPHIGLEVFTSAKECHHIAYDNVLELLQTESNSENALVEKYLRWLIEEKTVEAERFHTRLAKCYIDVLFQLHPAKEKGDVPAGAQGRQCQEYKKLLLKFLETSRHYRTSLVYDQIEGSWLIEAKVLLLCRDRNYDEALRIQVQQAVKNDRFEDVEQFCLRQGEGLLTKLLKLYISRVEEAEEGILAASKDDEKTKIANFNYDKGKFSVLAHQLLQKYAGNTELDPLQVIEMVPPNWLLNPVTASESLYSYLYVALSHTLHEVHSTMITKSVSEMDMLNVECEASKLKSASVRISQERLCPVCHKKIGDRPFAVYPNGNTVHQQCAANPSICPVTNINFETQL